MRLQMTGQSGEAAARGRTASARAKTEQARWASPARAVTRVILIGRDALHLIVPTPR
jgi:hypothetical protein